MSQSNAYFNASQQRILRTVLVLFGNVVDGISPSEIAKAVGGSASCATRDLWNLKHAGLAELAEEKRWRLTPAFPQRALAMLNKLDQMQRGLSECRNRYTQGVGETIVNGTPPTYE